MGAVVIMNANNTGQMGGRGKQATSAAQGSVAGRAGAMWIGTHTPSTSENEVSGQRRRESDIPTTEFLGLHSGWRWCARSRTSVECRAWGENWMGRRRNGGRAEGDVARRMSRQSRGAVTSVCSSAAARAA